MQVNSIEVNKMLHVQHSCFVSIMIITYVILHTTSLEFIYFTYYVPIDNSADFVFTSSSS